MHAAPCHLSDQVRSEQGDDIEIGDFAGSAKRENIMTTSMNTYEINTNKHAYHIVYRLVAGPHKQDKTKQKRAEQETSEVLKPQKRFRGVTTAALRYRDCWDRYNCSFFFFCYCKPGLLGCAWKAWQGHMLYNALRVDCSDCRPCRLSLPWRPRHVKGASAENLTETSNLSACGYQGKHIGTARSSHLSLKTSSDAMRRAQKTEKSNIYFNANQAFLASVCDYHLRS